MTLTVTIGSEVAPKFHWLATLNDYAPLIEATAIIISVIVAMIVFFYTRRVDRKRATLEMVMKTFLDEDGRKRYEKFKILVRKDQDESDPFKINTLSNRTVTNEENFVTLKDQLNDYELVALGIRRGLFDEKFYKLWFHRQFTKDYENVATLIAEIQNDRPATYCEFTNLYQRWIRHKHPVTHPNRFKMAWWGLTRNVKQLNIAHASMKD